MKFEARLYATHHITIVLRFIDTHNIFDDFLSHLMITLPSPQNQGVFQLLKKETQPAIAKEDWNTDGCLLCTKSITIYP